MRGEEKVHGFKGMLAGFSFVVAFICVVHVNACSPEINLRGPKRKRIASLLDSGIEQLTSRFLVDDLVRFEELMGANGVESL